jgi:hypothetical protein
MGDQAKVPTMIGEDPFMFASSHMYRHQRHRIVAEDVNHLHRHSVAPRPVVAVLGSGQFQLAAAEALPCVLEDVATGSVLCLRADPVESFWCSITQQRFEARLLEVMVMCQCLRNSSCLHDFE